MGQRLQVQAMLIKYGKNHAMYYLVSWSRFGSIPE